MILGLSTFTFSHVLISLVAILSGLVVLFGMIRSERMVGATAIFLAFTLATSVTGFFFPFRGLTPAIVLGIVSLVVLVPVLLARYAFHLGGPWCAVYAAGAAALLYFNCFVLVVQLFLKVPALHALAPNGSEPPFAIAQGALLLFFAVTGFLAVMRLRPTA